MQVDPQQPLLGQTALITGAASGIGEAVARRFASAGAAVGVNYRSRSGPADGIVADIQAHGGRAVAFQADMSREEDVRSMFAALRDAFGRIDILVANAGIQMDAPAAEMTLQQWQRVLDVNLTGQFLCAREAIRHFASQRANPHSRAAGKIICVSSVHEAIPWAGHVNYAASKGGSSS